MPELAEVEWYRKQWDPGLGHEILRVKIHRGKRVFRGSDPGKIQRQLTGARLFQSETRGKKMLFKFSRDIWLGIHLGMTGSLRVESPSFRPGKHDHLVLEQADRALVFRDSRLFGRIRFHQGRDQPTWWDSFVPEIGDDGFNRKWVDRILDRHAKAPIKAVLLMQHAFSGIGNWMADEILWRAKILPARRSQTLTKNERGALLRQTKFVARRSLETLGRDYADPPKGWLIHQRWKSGGVCPIHRRPLKRATVGGRTTAWCPQCQR